MHVDHANFIMRYLSIRGPIWIPKTSLRPFESQDHVYDM